jgi:mRNA interferase RelE/StbE
LNSSNPKFRVRFEAKAQKQLQKLDPQNQRRILLAAQLLADNPTPSKAVQLVGHNNLWRVRVGDFRIVYAVQNQDLIVLVVQVGHRRDVYKF